VRVFWILASSAIFLPGAAAFGLWQLSRVGVNQGYSPAQPIAFSHRLHAGENQVPCLYCHSAARSSRHAGIPAVSVCMNCHSLLGRQTAEIEKLKEAAQLGRPISWTRVHALPDFVSFDHSRHVLSSVACASCHGPVERMDRVEQHAPLTMGFCLDCHRERAGIPALGIQRAASHVKEGSKNPANMDCSACHY
jgi:Cytochrome c7 and related cytochrome c